MVQKIGELSTSIYSFSLCRQVLLQIEALSRQVLLQIEALSKCLKQKLAEENKSARFSHPSYKMYVIMMLY